MAEITKNIVANSDDGFWYGTTIKPSEDYINLGNNGSAVNCYFKFDNITIPSGVTINSAILTFTRWAGDNSSNILLKIYGNDIDDAVAPTNTTEANALVKTDASVSWTITEQWTGENEYSAPSIKDIIQEIIDRTGWTSGNSLMLIINDNGTGTGNTRLPYSYEGSSTKCAKLVINYTQKYPLPTHFNT